METNQNNQEDTLINQYLSQNFKEYVKNKYVTADEDIINKPEVL